MIKNMKPINEYAKTSKILNITINYGSDKFTFNLFKELVVDENRINAEIKEQPSAYAFLGMLHKKLIRIMKDKEREMEKKYSELYIKYKNEIDSNTGRVMANEVAREKTNAHISYQAKRVDFIEAEHNAQVLEVCVKSFEQRAQLIQTLSANIRKTN